MSLLPPTGSAVQSRLSNGSPRGPASVRVSSGLTDARLPPALRSSALRRHPSVIPVGILL